MFLAFIQEPILIDVLYYLHYIASENALVIENPLREEREENYADVSLWVKPGRVVYSTLSHFLCLGLSHTASPNWDDWEMPSS